MVEFKGKVDDQVFSQLRATCAQSNPFFRVAYPVIGLICLGFSIIIYVNSGLADAFPLAIAGILFINLRAIRLWFWWHRWKPRLIETLGPYVSGTSDGEGLSLNILDQRYAWKEFAGAKLSDDCAALYLDKTAAIPVARSWFTSRTDWDEFARFLRPHLRSWKYL